MRKLILFCSAVILVIYTVAMVCLFLWILFPTDYFRQWIPRYLQGAFPQYALTIDDLALEIPGQFQFTEVLLSSRRNKMPVLLLDSAVIRPDLGLLKSSGRLEYAYQAELYDGSVAGQIQPGSTQGEYRIKAMVEEIDLGANRALSSMVKRNIQGIVQGQIVGAISLARQTLIVEQGEVEVADGEIELQDQVFGNSVLPFTHIFCQVQGNQRSLSLNKGTVQSPLFTASFSGQVHFGPSLEKTRVDISGTIRPDASFFASLANRQVVEAALKGMGEDGFRFIIKGLLQEPGIQYSQLGSLALLLERGRF